MFQETPVEMIQWCWPELCDKPFWIGLSTAWRNYFPALKSPYQFYLNGRAASGYTTGTAEGPGPWPNKRVEQSTRHSFSSISWQSPLWKLYVSSSLNSYQYQDWNPLDLKQTWHRRDLELSKIKSPFFPSSFKCVVTKWSNPVLQVKKYLLVICSSMRKTSEVLLGPSFLLPVCLCPRVFLLIILEI